MHSRLLWAVGKCQNFASLRTSGLVYFKVFWLFSGVGGGLVVLEEEKLSCKSRRTECAFYCPGPRPSSWTLGPRQIHQPDIFCTFSLFWKRREQTLHTGRQTFFPVLQAGKSRSPVTPWYIRSRFLRRLLSDLTRSLLNYFKNELVVT